MASKIELKELLKDKVFIIAEAGVNHNGDIRLAFQLVDAAIAAGADAVKFQTFITEKSICQEAELAPYQKAGLENVKTQFEMAQELELTFEEFRDLKKYCDQKGIMFLSTPDEEDSLAFLCALGTPLIKIGSGEITNGPLLKAAAQTQKPLLLSTGISEIHEIEQALTIFYREGNSNVALLHCVSEYPAPAGDINLRAIKTMREYFKVPVGFSDHSQGLEIAVAAVALGSQIIEKHFTLDKSLPGPDHAASLDPRELKALVTSIRNVEQAMGDGIKRPAPCELRNKNMIRRSIVAGRDLRKGERITRDDLMIKKPGHGIVPHALEEIVGHIVKSDIKKDELILWEKLN